jgi:hypothetical protein
MIQPPAVLTVPALPWVAIGVTARLESHQADDLPRRWSLNPHGPHVIDHGRVESRTLPNNRTLYRYAWGIVRVVGIDDLGDGELLVAIEPER